MFFRVATTTYCSTQLDRRMLQEVYEALETRDLVLVLMDATRRVQLEAAAGDAGPSTPSAATDCAQDDTVVVAKKRERTNWASEDEFLFGLIRKLDCPVFLLLTKIDLVAKDHLLPLIDTLTRQFDFAQVIPVSARKRDGLDSAVARSSRRCLWASASTPRISTPTSRSASWLPN